MSDDLISEYFLYKKSGKDIKIDNIKHIDNYITIYYTITPFSGMSVFTFEEVRDYQIEKIL